jgi:deoxyribodipyrimidine photo-lyase
MENIIVWFRNDLRIHDNEVLCKAQQRGACVIPVYCIDPRQFEETALGFSRTGSFRASFLLESLADLRQRLRSLGSDLLIYIGKPEEIIPELQARLQAKAVYASQEVTFEEQQVEKRLEEILFKVGCELKLFWQSTLYHLEDLPFPMRSLPDVFTDFRKQVEKTVKVRRSLPEPLRLDPLPVQADSTPMPELADLGLEVPPADPRRVLCFKGGETAAKVRLKEYFWDGDFLRNYKETRNGLLGADYSSKFSAWLSLGCLSPRYIYDEVFRYEQKRVKNESTYWLIFEIIWRDYFRFVAKKYGTSMFMPGGIRNDSRQRLYDNEQLFWQWANGQTGVPFIDANMQELNQTGFMSNRGRQNVASFLVKDLRVNWQWGAMYFESQLIDYDVCSNWGNWNYVAGVGNDPRENRYFNIPSQAKRYDPQGAYVRCWLPQLAEVPVNQIHDIPELPAKVLKNYGVSLGGNYPYAIVKAQPPKEFSRRS